MKLAAFVIFATFITVLFEIHQRFKGHLLNELHVSFKTLRKSLSNAYGGVYFLVTLQPVNLKIMKENTGKKRVNVIVWGPP